MKTATNAARGLGRKLTPVKNRTIGARHTKISADGNASQPNLKIRSILVPLDFSAPSIKALKYAARFAEEFGAKLTLLTVIEPVGMPDFMESFPLVMESEQISSQAESRLRSLVAKNELPPRLVEKTLVRTGVPFHEITSAARTLKSDLIIIATNGNTGFKHLMLGSTTERVVRYAPCPVFVVREEERELMKIP